MIKLNFRLMRLGVLCASLFVLAACGFHLRGVANIPFQTLYLKDSGTATPIARDMRRSLKVNGVTVVNTPQEAQGSLELMSESNEKRILSLSGNGRVREYEIIYRVVFRIRDSGTELWDPAQTVEQRRDFTFDDTQVLAKEGEEVRLINDMRSETIREIIRRVSVLSKRKTAADEIVTPAPVEERHGNEAPR